MFVRASLASQRYKYAAFFSSAWHVLGLAGLFFASTQFLHLFETKMHFCCLDIQLQVVKASRL